MNEFTEEDIATKGFTVRLFTNQVWYVECSSNSLVRYAMKLVKGKEKPSNTIVETCPIEELYGSIKQVYDKRHTLLAERKTANQKLVVKGAPQELQQKNPIFCLSFSGIVVPYLTQEKRKQVRESLALEGVTYVTFENFNGQTKITTSPKGYRVLGYLQTR